ncbi:hypothetical protein PTTG_07051 [Puccinia triticina 1-1 BBBD Race 1]|uniref:UCR_hinge domain-containing protein n=2 Tax=Puccinia triticina (isolate 1-1 / race 1 (BBBD)) TaxID=630390 RepID=A0A180G397_PUCT1|nr:hypothetical protein PTTG_07051 [Puccinia triticina 1-1 BBBD Race 1]
MTNSNSSTSSSPPATSFTEVCSNVASAITQYFTPTVVAEAKEATEEEEEEEEDEPEDPAPAIREECAESKCSKYKRHFDHCQERVLGGKGDKGEDCVEELFHLMHCVDECATPQVFSKLV